MTPKTPSKSFELDELVFAKVKGYPHWPARITEVKTPGKFYSVIFFGTKETGNIKTSELWSYYTHKDKFINDKTLKNPLFLKGTVEIRQLSGDASPKIEETTTVPDASTPAKSEVKSTPKKGKFAKFVVIKLHCFVKVLFLF